MVDAKIESLVLDIAEGKKLLDLSSRSKIADILSIGIRKLETELLQLKEKQKEAADAHPNPSNPPPSSTSSSNRTYDVQIKNFSWDQSDKFVKIYLTGLKNVQSLSGEENRIKVEFTDRSVAVRVDNLEGKNFLFNIKEFCQKINAQKSHFKIKSDMISLFMCKDSPNSKWSHLTKAEKEAADAKAAKMAPKDKDNADPQASLMNMMKNLYDEGDDEMKRTIAKAWTEGQSKKSSDDAMGRLPPMDF